MPTTNQEWKIHINIVVSRIHKRNAFSPVELMLPLRFLVLTNISSRDLINLWKYRKCQLISTTHISVLMNWLQILGWVVQKAVQKAVRLLRS